MSTIINVGDGPTTLGTGTTTLYTVPASYTFKLQSILVSEISGAGRTFNLSRDGTAATAANCFAYLAAISANGFVSFDNPILFSAGETFQGLASAASAVQVTWSGVLIQ